MSEIESKESGWGLLGVYVLIIGLFFLLFSSCRVQRENSRRVEKIDSTGLLKQNFSKVSRLDSSVSFFKKDSNTNASINTYTRKTTIKEYKDTSRLVKETTIEENGSITQLQTGSSITNDSNILNKFDTTGLNSDVSSKVNRQEKTINKHSQNKGIHWSIYLIIIMLLLGLLVYRYVKKKAKQVNELLNP